MRFNSTEDGVIINHVSHNSANLKKACLNAAIQLNRTFFSVYSHYYHVLKPKMTIEAYRTTAGGKKLPNVKNIPIISNPMKQMEAYAKTLAKRQAQTRKTTKCLSEIARIKYAMKELSKHL